MSLALAGHQVVRELRQFTALIRKPAAAQTIGAPTFRQERAMAFSRARRWTLASLAILGISALDMLGGVYAYEGVYGLNLLRHHGAVYWANVRPDDLRLSASMRLVLANTAPPAEAGPFAWRQILPGLEVTEMPVVASGRQVDLVYLARVDPSRFRFVVRTDPAGNTDLRQWMHKLGATLVINGSYYGRHGEPATPVLAGGGAQGAMTYAHGGGAAFVASQDGAALLDLSREDWHATFRGASDALVSFPLLLGEDLADVPVRPSGWLANRSFLGEDRTGRIILGTTADAFFSLNRLAIFLRHAPLDLRIAVNLDGGPVACQAVAVPGFSRDVCGRYEMQEHHGRLQLLTLLFGRPVLPVALAALPR